MAHNTVALDVGASGDEEFDALGDLDRAVLLQEVFPVDQVDVGFEAERTFDGGTAVSTLNSESSRPQMIWAGNSRLCNDATIRSSNAFVVSKLPKICWKARPPSPRASSSPYTRISA